MKGRYTHRWQQFADDLLDDILHTGIEVLPGMRALGKQYQVSRSTVERALEYLVELRFIHAPVHGKARQVHLENVARSLQKDEGSIPKVLFLVASSDTVQITHTGRKIYTSARNLLAEEGIQLDYIVQPHSLSQLNSILTGLKPLGIIAYGTSALIVDEIIDAGYPVIGIGCSSARIPRFNTDYSELILSAMQRAWAAGHQLVCCPLWNRKIDIQAQLSDQLSTHFAEVGKQFSATYHLPDIQGSSPVDYHQALDSLFAYTPPSCLIVGNFAQYLMATSYLSARNFRIPEDVSLIVLSADPYYDYISPSIAHFSIDLEECSAQVVLAMLSRMKGSEICDEVEVESIWNPGASLKIQ